MQREDVMVLVHTVKDGGLRATSRTDNNALSSTGSHLPPARLPLPILGPLLFIMFVNSLAKCHSLTTLNSFSTQMIFCCISLLTQTKTQMLYNKT